MNISTHGRAAKRSLIVLGSAGLLVAAVACSQAPAPTATVAPTSTSAPAAGSQAATNAPAGNAQVSNSSPNATSAPVSRVVSSTGSGVVGQASTGVAPAPVTTYTSPDGSVATSYAGLIPYPGNAGANAGISVNGTGQINVKPDIAILNLAVQARDATVTVARDQAATGMTAVINAIKAQGVSADDIQTTGFSIQPQTVYRQVADKSGTYQQPEIDGYIVSNSISVTVRDVNKAADVIDAATQAGGNLLRINGVSFSVSDPSQYAAQVRKLAAKDAKAKAQAYADAMGVQLGPLVSLSETGSSVPIVAPQRLAMDSGAAASVPTPLNPGNTTITASVQARFAIQTTATAATSTP